MGLKIKAEKTLPIGVDLGTSTLKMAQLKTTESSFALVAAQCIRVPAECRSDFERQLDMQCDEIRRMLKNGRFKGRRAILSLPAAATFLQPIKIPLSPPAGLENAIKDEVRESLPYSLDDAVIRHILGGIVYKDGEQIQERIVIAASRNELKSYLSMANRAGLDVVGVNIDACAIVECFARTFRRATDESRVTLFIDIGSANTQVVLAHGQKMAFARNLNIGGQALDQTVSSSLDISLEQAQQISRTMLNGETTTAAEDDLFRLLDTRIADIAERITQCLRYHESVFHSPAIDHVVFVGGQAHNSRLCRSIAERLNLPAKVGDPLAGMKRDEDSDGQVGLDTRRPQPSWAVAIGLSMGATVAA